MLKIHIVLLISIIFTGCSYTSAKINTGGYYDGSYESCNNEILIESDSITAKSICGNDIDLVQGVVGSDKKNE